MALLHIYLDGYISWYNIQLFGSPSHFMLSLTDFFICIFPVAPPTKSKGLMMLKHDSFLYNQQICFTADKMCSSGIERCILSQIICFSVHI